jgi:UDP-2-acetamido-3-amino-2,3-dideoxy-glucuronate N-acetyltransferase
MEINNHIHPTAVVDQPCIIGEGTRIWHFSHICEGAKIGDDCSLGQNTFVSGGVVMGTRVKVQNNVSLYDGITIEDDVFLGPSCVLTNISNPRSQVVRKALYEKTWIRRGATIGANATVICGVTIGRYAFVGAGAVIRSDVPDYAMMLGVPAIQSGWMSRHGHKLNFDDEGNAICPESKLRYQLEGGKVCCLDLSEENPLPEELASGKRSYQDYKREES